jgi:response regulator NasT
MSNQNGDTRLDSDTQLRVLVANERPERLAVLTGILTGLGHTVVVRGSELETLGESTQRERVDVALVALGESSQRALDLISVLVEQAACPVIALLAEDAPGFAEQASRRGVYAHVSGKEPQRLQAALRNALRRFDDYQRLDGAFGRRATIERAKGILMAVHGVDEHEAFELLRTQSQHSGRRLLDLAEAVVDSHRLLVPPDVLAHQGR